MPCSVHGDGSEQGCIDWLRRQATKDQTKDSYTYPQNMSAHTDLLRHDELFCEEADNITERAALEEISCIDLPIMKML